MTADKIRAQVEALECRAGRYDDQGELGALGDIQLQTAFFLGEIAAQLAELNERLAKPMHVEGHIQPHAVHLSVRSEGAQ